MGSMLSAFTVRGARRVASMAGVLLVSGVAGPALADVAPPQSCTAPGQPCDKAGPAANQPGTCTPSTCQRGVQLADGGFGTMSYACNLCTPPSSDGGAGDAAIVHDGAANTGGAGGAGNGAGTGGAGTGGAGTGGAAEPSATGGAVGTGGRAPDAGTDKPSNGSGCAIIAGPIGSPSMLVAFVSGLLLFVRSRRRAR